MSMNIGIISIIKHFKNQREAYFMNKYFNITAKAKTVPLNLRCI